MAGPRPGHPRGGGRAAPWNGGHVVLGVTGGIAAYKAVQVARDLTELGAAVDVVMTASARAFVGELSFEGVTGRRVRTDILEPGLALDHIRLAREADVICVAPATADFMARAAGGRADDMLTAVLLATRAPVLICPAMNDAMWSHAATQANAARLRELGYTLVGPAEGPLAYGEGSGPGRMEEPAAIVQQVGRHLRADTSMAGRRVLVTAGPTREAVDPVRFLSNRSSGRMGIALAVAAWRRGADVDLVLGPGTVEPPPWLRVHRVETGDEMKTAVSELLPDRDLLIMAAAPADFRPAHVPTSKIRKEDGTPSLALEAAPDILVETIGDRPEGCMVVGFALETNNGEESARRKLATKRLDLVILNQTSAESGFDVDTNQVTVLDPDGNAESLPLLPKVEVAEQLLDRIERRMPGRAR